MALTIDELEIQIQAEAKKATNGIDALASSMKRLQDALGNSSALASNLTKISEGLKSFSSIGKFNLTSPVKQIAKLKETMSTFSGEDASRFAKNLKDIADAFNTFSSIKRINMKSFANGLKALPQIFEDLKPGAIDQFAAKTKLLAESMSPLAAEMDKIARGFEALPKSMLKALKSSDNMHEKTQKVNTSFGKLTTRLYQATRKYKTLYYDASRVSDVFAEWLNESNEYIEALNLFRVAMGSAAKEAEAYAEKVGEALGIDPADWMRNQGVFMRMASGFGISADKAEVMSQNLTQLAYDLSSFFNTDIETAMQKLQSGMSGQIKGLKAWGYNLSVASLQETALSLGIDKSVRSMSEAEKAQLRYITLIKRSNGIMGDMAKTITSPANAMRVLDAQMTKLKRSLGNLVSVFVTKLVPWITVTVELVTEFTDKLAEAWGFEIPEFPKVDLELGSESIEEAEQELAALKRQLMGFDELNILNSDEKTSSVVEGSLVNFDLPEYDFLEKLDTSSREYIEAIKDKVIEFAEELGKIMPLITGIGAALAVSWSINGIMNAINAFKELKVVQAIVTSFMGALETFHFAFEGGLGIMGSFGEVIKSIPKSLKKLRSSLSPVSKALIALGGAVVTFETIKKNIKGLTDGSKSFGEAMLAIVPICGAVGVAVYAMTGPIGLAVTAIAGIAGAIVGFNQAQNEMIRDISRSTFYADYGTSISELGDAFNELLSSSTVAYDGIFKKQDTILTAKQNISDTLAEVDNLVFGVENGAINIQNAIPTIVSAFETLYKETSVTLTATRDLIIGALSGSIGEALENEGILIGEVIASSGNITDAALEAIEAIKTANEELKVKWEAGEIDDDAYFAQLTENIEKMRELGGTINDQSEVINNANASFATAIKDALSGNLTWDSSSGVSDVLDGLIGSANETKSTITEAYRAVIEAMETEKQIAEALGDTEKASLFANTITALTTAMNNETANVDSTLGSVVDALQTDLFKKIQSVIENAKTGYEDTSWFYKLGTSEAEHITKALESFKDGELSEMVALFKEKFPNANLWVEEAFNKFMEDADGNYLSDEYANTLNESLGEDLFSSIPDLRESSIPESAKETINGLTNALNGGTGDVYTAANNLGNSVLNGYDDALDINSPSVEMQKRGEYSLQGLVNGLSNTSLLKVAIDNIVAQFDILNPIKSLWQKVSDWWKNISLPEINLFGNLGAKIFGAFNVGAYASGGFPSMGEMFIARESGPEMVGRIGNKNAVANNNQITQGIASAVYNAMMAANEDGSGGGGSNAKIIVQIGDTPIGEAAVRFINGKIVQTGVNPIYG